MNTSDLEKEKKIAAIHSVRLVKDGMKVGLGTGSTSKYMIEELGARVENGLSILGVPSSQKSFQLAKDVGIPLTTLKEAGQLDINIDGADEFDTEFRLIKGGGGALLREKILAYNANFNIIIADSGKRVERLGKFKLPVETIPMASPGIFELLRSMELKPIMRRTANTEYLTDENNFIIDIDILNVKDISGLNNYLIQIPGVVETGLFLQMTDLIIMGKDHDTVVYENNRPRINKYGPL